MKEKYEWDENKRRDNLAKHEIYFSAASEFDWDTAFFMPDNRSGERRIVAYGFIGKRLHVIVHTEREDRRRIISLRKANSREVMRYEQEQG